MYEAVSDATEKKASPKGTTYRRLGTYFHIVRGRSCFFGKICEKYGHPGGLYNLLVAMAFKLSLSLDIQVHAACKNPPVPSHRHRWKQYYLSAFLEPLTIAAGRPVPSSTRPISPNIRLLLIKSSKVLFHPALPGTSPL